MTTQTKDKSSQSDGAAPAPSPDEEFDAALAEMNSGDDAPADDAAADIPEDVPIEDAEDDPAPADDDAAEPETPAAPPEEDAPAGDNPEDIWSSADPKLREAHEKALKDAELRHKGAASRQTAMQNQLADLKAQLAELEKQKGQPQGGKDSEEDKADRPESERDKRLNYLREEYPDLSEPILQEIEESRAKISEFEPIIARLRQDEINRESQAQEAILQEAHQDWPEAVRDDRFQGWLGSQSTAIQEAFARNAERWVDGADAALVIGKFKADVGFGKPTAPPEPADQGEKAKRQRQLAGGREAPVRSPAVSTTGPDDQDFDAWVDRYTQRSGKA